MMKRQLKTLPDAPQRSYLPDTFKVKTWKSIEPYFKELLRREITDEPALEEWLANRGELSAIFKDDLLLRQVQSMQNQQEEQLQDSYRYALLYMLPRMEAYEDKLNQRFLNFDLLGDLSKEYRAYIAKVRRDVQLYHKKNAGIRSELVNDGMVYEQKLGDLRNLHERREKQGQDESSEADARLEHEKSFRSWALLLREEELYFDIFLSDILKRRQKMAENLRLANFDDYQVARDFRQSYGTEEIIHLHQQVQEWVLPLLNKLLVQKRERRQLKKLRPWDLRIYPKALGVQAMASSTNELLESVQTCLDLVYPPFAEHLQSMSTLDLLDLSPRPNKAKREYLSSFHENRYSFLSMNASGNLRDLQLLSRQMGKAMQAYYSSDIRPYYLSDSSLEIKDLAGYSLELFTMHHWPSGVFDKTQLAMDAQAHVLEENLLQIVRLTIGDCFQRWLHKHPNHSSEEREAAWLDIHKSYYPEEVDWSGLEELRAKAWLEEYRVFQSPERYLQQILARLGSFATWRDYRAWPLQTLQRYIRFLKQGGRKEVEESFASLGLQLAYQDDFIKELMDYLSDQLKSLQN